MPLVNVGLDFLEEKLKEFDKMNYGSVVAGQYGSASAGQVSGLSTSAPPRPTRSLLESRNSLVDGLDHLQGSINLLDSLLDTFRGSQPPANIEKRPLPSGTLQSSLDCTAEYYQETLNRLRRRLEELDSVLGAGFSQSDKG